MFERSKKTMDNYPLRLFLYCKEIGFFVIILMNIFEKYLQITLKCVPLHSIL